MTEERKKMERDRGMRGERWKYVVGDGKEENKEGGGIERKKGRRGKKKGKYSMRETRGRWGSE